MGNDALESGVWIDTSITQVTDDVHAPPSGLRARAPLLAARKGKGGFNPRGLAPSDSHSDLSPEETVYSSIPPSSTQESSRSKADDVRDAVLNAWGSGQLKPPLSSGRSVTDGDAVQLSPIELDALADMVAQRLHQRMERASIRSGASHPQSEELPRYT